MFANLWKKCLQWQSSARRQPLRRKRATLSVDVLESRVTPTNVNVSVSSNGIFTIDKSASGAIGLTLTSSGIFGGYTLTANAGDTIETNLATFTTPAGSVNEIVFNLGTGDDNITIDGSGANGPVNLSNGLTINGSGGNKTFIIRSVNVLDQSDFTMKLTGNGTLSTTIQDVNVSGPATISHTGSGNTSLTFSTSGNNATSTNYWDSLAVTDGTGTDTNTIHDTDFAGNVSITNGNGASGNVINGGSQTIFSDGNNKGLLNVGGDLKIYTSSGQSDTEVYDYNVKGTLTVNTGNGVRGLASNVSIEQKQTVGGSGVPSIGAIDITATAVTGPSPGVTVGIGDPLLHIGDTPLYVPGTVSITANGSGSAQITLYDLTVAGATSIALGSSTSNDSVALLGDSVNTQNPAIPQYSNYGNVTITSSASGANTYDIQDDPNGAPAGITNINGALTFKLANAADTINIGTNTNYTDVAHTTGNLVIDGGKGSKTINVIDSTLGGLSMDFTSSSNPTSVFTDTNVTGAATYTHNSGISQFTIADTANNPQSLNTWNSLVMNNGTGTSTNLISDTDFAGNVTINNGNGGAQTMTVLHANLDTTLLTIAGNLSITNGSGQYKTDVYDYNINGNVTLTSGSGARNGAPTNYIGLEDNQTTQNSGVPVIGGSVTITATAANGLSPGVQVALGTDQTGTQNYPLDILGNLNITGNGTGAVQITLNDLNVNNGTTTISLAASTDNDILNVQGDNANTPFISQYYNFVLVSSALGNNTYNFQDQAGTLYMNGTVTMNLGNGNDTVDLGADVGNQGGVNKSVVDFFGTSLISGGGGVNLLYVNPYTAGGNFGFYFNPVLRNI